MKREHESHDWGPHKRGIRWVQCQACECLLHEPEANDECLGSPEARKPLIEARTRLFWTKMNEVLRRESSWRP